VEPFRAPPIRNPFDERLRRPSVGSEVARDAEHFLGASTMCRAVARLAFQFGLVAVDRRGENVCVVVDQAGRGSFTKGYTRRTRRWSQSSLYNRPASQLSDTLLQSTCDVGANTPGSAPSGSAGGDRHGRGALGAGPLRATRDRPRRRPTRIPRRLLGRARQPDVRGAEGPNWSREPRLPPRAVTRPFPRAARSPLRRAALAGDPAEAPRTRAKLPLKPLSGRWHATT
jgi:hypothetical protein